MPWRSGFKLFIAESKAKELYKVYILFWLKLTAFGSYLGYLLCAFHPCKQGLNDIIGETFVVHAKNRERCKLVHSYSHCYKRQS